MNRISLVVALVLAGPVGARAEPSSMLALSSESGSAGQNSQPTELESTSIEDKAQDDRQWYGMHNVLAYLVADVSLVAAGTSQDWGLVIPAAILRTHAGMLVHFGHGNWGTGFVSLGIVLGGTVGGALLGFTLGKGASSVAWDEGGVLGGLIGTGLGVVTGTLIDISILAFDEPDHEPGQPRISLSAQPTSGGMTFGVGGRF